MAAPMCQFNDHQLGVLVPFHLPQSCSYLQRHPINRLKWHRVHKKGMNYWRKKENGRLRMGGLCSSVMAQSGAGQGKLPQAIIPSICGHNPAPTLSTLVEATILTPLPQSCRSDLCQLLHCFNFNVNPLFMFSNDPVCLSI